MNQLFVLLGISSWKPVLSALVLPPVPWLVLVLVGTRLVFSRRALGWSLVLAAVSLSWLSTCSGSARLLAQALLQPAPALSAQRIAELKDAVKSREPIAIVVLGGGVRPRAPEYGVSDLAEMSLQRLRYGIWLGRQTGAPVGFSGGVGWGVREGSTLSEAEVAARIAAEEFGAPLRWQEARSRDTRENAAYSVALLKPLGIRHVVLVTHQAHMARAQRAFEEAAQGAMRIEAAPLDLLQSDTLDAKAWLPSRRGFETVNLVLHEVLGLLLGA